MKKRKQPFGYEINRGVAVINATESCIVKGISTCMQEEPHSKKS